VSLYNETKGEGIYPTPVIGIVGILDDVTKAVPSSFRYIGDKVLLLQSTTETDGSPSEELGSSDFAKSVCGSLWGVPPYLNLKSEGELHCVLAKLAQRGLIHSAKDISDGGLAVALAQSCFDTGIGVHVNLGALGDAHIPAALFGENATEVLITCAPEAYGEICYLLDEDASFFPLDIGDTIAQRLEIFADDDPLVDVTLAELKSVYANSLELQLAEEVLA
jgi:phosphoribosylformylglycinamidine synthase